MKCGAKTENGGRRSGILHVCLVAAACLLLLSTSTRAQCVSTAGGLGVGLGWQEVEITDKPIERLTHTPAFRSARPVYLNLRLGAGEDNRITAIIDESAGPDTGYDVMYLDANNNGDMGDDPVIRPKATRRGRLTSLETEPIPVRVKYASDAVRDLHVKIEARGYKRRGVPHASWVAGCHLTDHLQGHFEVGSRRNVLVGFYDASTDAVDGNGRFDDYGVDRLRIDLDGNGILDEKHEAFPLSKALSLDGALWRFDIDASAHTLTCEPSDLPTGRVRVAGKFADDAEIRNGWIELVSEDGFGFGFPLSGDSALSVPEANYAVNRIRLSILDSEQREWDAAVTVEKDIIVRREQESMIPVGAPFAVEPLIEGDTKPGVSICLAARLVGVGGELYDNIAPRKVRMKPSIDIVDVEDIVVAHGKMEHG